MPLTSVAYSSVDIHTFDHTPEIFVDMVIHTNYGSRESYIEAITSFLSDHRDNQLLVQTCLNYLELAADYDIKNDIIIHILNKKSKSQVKYMWAERFNNPELPF